MNLIKKCLVIALSSLIQISAAAEYSDPKILGSSQFKRVVHKPVRDVSPISVDVMLSSNQLEQALYNFLLPPQTSILGGLQGPNDGTDISHYIGEIEIPGKEVFSLFRGENRKDWILKTDYFRNQLEKKNPDLMKVIKRPLQANEKYFYLGMPPRGPRLWPTNEYKVGDRSTLFRANFWIILRALDTQRTHIEIYEDSPTVLAGYTTGMNAHTFKPFKGYDWRSVPLSTQDPLDLLNLLKDKATEIKSVTMPRMPENVIDWSDVSKLVNSKSILLSNLELVKTPASRDARPGLHFSFDVINDSDVSISEYLIGYGNVNVLGIRYDIKQIDPPSSTSIYRSPCLTYATNCGINPFPQPYLVRGEVNKREKINIPPQNKMRFKDSLSLYDIKPGHYKLIVSLESIYRADKNIKPIQIEADFFIP